ncbi:hypothetical protein HDU86_006527 [Geranomyces michiganensis]|nr:hypothetical protein HDU86_006527 [Geranomyces michiganensis]
MPPKRKAKKTTAVPKAHVEPTLDAEQATVAVAGKRKRTGVSEFWKVAVDADEMMPAKAKPAKTAAGGKSQRNIAAANDEESEDELVAAVSAPSQSVNVLEESEDELTSEAPARTKSKSVATTKRRKAVKPNPPPALPTVDAVAKNANKKRKVIDAGATSASPVAAEPSPAPQPAKKRSAVKSAIVGPDPADASPPRVRKNAPAKLTGNVTNAATEAGAVTCVAQAAEDEHAVAAAPEPGGNVNSKASLAALREPLLAGEWVSRSQHDKLRFAIQQLEARYELLKQTGVKDAEASLTTYKRTAEARIQACESHNTTLQRETEALRAQLATAQTAQLQLETRLAEAQADAKNAQMMLAERDAAVKGGEKAAARAASEAIEKKASAEAKRLQGALEKAGAENIALLGEVDALKGKVKQTAARLVAQDERLTAQAAEIQRLQVNDEYLVTVERMVRMFEELTGVTIQTVKDVRRPVSEDEDEGDEESNGDADGENSKEIPAILFQCKQMGRNGALDYNLYTPTETTPSTTSTSGSVTYECEPLARIGRDGRTAGELPDFLQGPIRFQRKMCSMFFWRACNFLNSVD